MHQNSLSLSFDENNKIHSCPASRPAGANTRAARPQARHVPQGPLGPEQAGQARLEPQQRLVGPADDDAAARGLPGRGCGGGRRGPAVPRRAGREARRQHGPQVHVRRQRLAAVGT